MLCLELDYNKLLGLVGEMGYRLMESGAEIYRVEESVRRLLTAYGLQPQVFAIPNCLIVSFNTPTGHPITQMRRIPAHGTDIELLERCNDLCRRLCQEVPPLEEAKAQVDALEEQVSRMLADGSTSADPVEAQVTTAPPAEPDFDAIQSEICVPAADAYLDQDSYEIVPSVTGVDFDVENARQLLNDAAEGSDVSVPVTLTEPKVTTATLEANLFKDVLGTGSTKCAGPSARWYNIDLAASRINGVILMPGDVFSYNDHCGPYTLASGYQKAGTYQNGTEYTVVATALNLNRDLLRLIQKFDFTKKNPKLIFINTTEKILSLEDSILVAYLNLVGFDILFFVPTGYQCIEKYLPEGYVNEHQIGEYLYDLSVPNLNAVQEGGLSSIRRLFGRST